MTKKRVLFLKRLWRTATRQKVVRFQLSSRFRGRDGSVLAWEMKQLNIREKVRVRERETLGNKTEYGKLLALAAEALTIPDLHDKGLMLALTERENRPVLTPMDAMMAILSEGELRRLLEIYTQFNEGFFIRFGDEKAFLPMTANGKDGILGGKGQ